MSTKYNAYITPPGPSRSPYQRLSWAKKKAYDFRIIEEIADYYDCYRGQYSDTEYIDKLKVNYDLFAGRGKQAMDAYHLDYGADLFSEGLMSGYDTPQHYPVINQFARAMVGEQQRRPLSAVAVDSSKYNMNVRKMERNRLMHQFLQKKILEPIQQQSMKMVMERAGVEDPYTLPPEQQEELQRMIQQQTKLMTPDEIDNYMRKDYKSPSEIQAQRLLDFLIQDLNVKFFTDEAFKHFIVSGREVVRIYVNHGKVKMEVVNPMGFDYASSSNTHFIEDGEWAKYEQYLKYPDIFTRLGDKIGTKELKKLENEFITYGDGRDLHEMPENMVGRVVIDESAPDIRTQEGQEYIKRIYERFGSPQDGYNSVRHVHIAFKVLRKFKLITRIVDGKKKEYWLDENYTFNPDRGDKKEEIFWIPRVWEVDKFGTKDGIYINKRPVPDQYASIHNPWDVKLPYIGIEFNRMFENSKHVSPLDFGKPWQYLINLELAKIQEANATDIGKVLVSSLSYLPQDWDPGKFFAMMKYGKTAWVNPDQEAANNPAAGGSFLKGVDLSNTPQIQGRIQYLQFLIGWMGQAMSYNSSRMGQNERYMAVANAQQNIVQSQYQTEDIYNTHNVFLENVLNALVRSARTAFRENEFMASYILDDMSRAELEINWDIMDVAEIGVKIRNSSEDFVRVQQIKQLGQAMVQNGMITMPELVKLMYANNGAEVLNVAEFAQKNAEQQRQMAHQQAMEQQQQQQQIQQQLMQMKQMMEMQKEQQRQQFEYKRTIDAATLESMKMANQYDINQNMINDSIEKEAMRIEHEKEESEKERQLKLKLAEMENEIEKMKAGLRKEK